MSYLALYRKYRPQSFDDMVGQSSIIKILKNEILNNKISHAYLFSGPRGTGKTTTAKIIAKMVNCENNNGNVPCGTCNSCLNILSSSDVIEIDAASNNGVDEIRNIRDKVNLVPGECKYKVYIIDEVHMLTTQAFNALLKTLEEPPSHVIFILATTEAHKIPLTILSRCQKFNFKRISNDDIFCRLKFICREENFNINDSVLFEIVRYCDGCCRDAVNLLDQVCCISQNIEDESIVSEIVGGLSYKSTYEFILSIFDSNSKFLVEHCESFNVDGVDLLKVVDGILVMLKNVVIFNNLKSYSFSDYEVEYLKNLASLINERQLVSLIDCLSLFLTKAKLSNYSYILLLISLLDFRSSYVDTCSNFSVSNDNVTIGVSGNLCSSSNSDVNHFKQTNVRTISASDISIRINNCLAGASKDKLSHVKECFSKISDYIFDDRYSFVCGLFKDCVPVVCSDNYLILSSSISSSVDRLNDKVYLLECFLHDVFGYNLFVVVVSSIKWDEIKNDYIKKIKSGVAFKFLDYNPYSFDESNVSCETNEIKNDYENDVDLLKNVVGNDIIDYV